MTESILNSILKGYSDCWFILGISGSHRESKSGISYSGSHRESKSHPIMDCPGNKVCNNFISQECWLLKLLPNWL